MRQKNKFNFVFRLQELLLVIFLIISGVFLTFKTGGFIINFRNVGFTILSTIEKGVSYVTFFVKDSVTEVKKHFNLKEEYEILLDKVKNYEYMQNTNANIRKENARLKEQLAFVKNLNQKNISANIISRGADNLHTTLIINKGSNHGIKKNMPVITTQDGNIGMVGKIINVGYVTSQIMPIYNIDCSISARLQNTRDIGLISGNGTEDLPLSMKYIKKRVIEELHYGDVIVTSGENGNYLKDIPIGTISKITILDYDTSLDIEVNPIVNFSRLESVVIISTDDSQINEEIKGYSK